jgi:hypothetical protein
VKIDLDLTGAEGVSLAAVVAGEGEPFAKARAGSAAFQVSLEQFRPSANCYKPL